MTAMTVPLAAGPLLLVLVVASGGLTSPGSPGTTPVADAPASPDADKQVLATRAREILKTHCYRCHGQDGSVEGAMNYVADLGKLVARKKVVPGDPDASRLFLRVDDGSMPPPDEKPRPGPEEVAILKKWIEAGAPGGEPAAPRKAITTADVLNYVLADLETIDRRARRFQRYFTLTHLYNAGLSDEELQTYRNALAKLVNSLSWHPKVTNPVAVDPAKTVLRIDLRWYVWDATTWNRVLQEYPYGVLNDTVTARAVMVATAARLPVIRADWFVGTASRAPLYYDVLQLPASLTELERQLRVDAVANIQQERVVRVGFNGSGVSRFNRILERHDSAQGVYWRSYDFDEPPASLTERVNGALLPDRRNIFAFPLGPGLVEAPFQHAGGEAIFTLPNGLHAFFLARADNTRLDKGPIAIVSDPKRPDRAVEAGVSCMSCHVSGILPKADQIRDHLEKNPKAFSHADADRIRALYPPREKSLALMQDDAKKYAEAVARTGAKVSRFEAVSTVTLKYEADLDLAAAAAEVGLVPGDFRDRIVASETLTRHVGALRAPGGTITRQLWVQVFGDVARELRLGALFQANLSGPTLPDNTGEIDPLESRDGAVNGIVFTPDGRRALIASGDRSVRLYDVEGRRDLKRFIGHTASVWAVALSSDGRLALSGSMDGTARVWDVATGQERKKLAGHDSLVSAVAWAGPTPFVVTGGFDGAVIKWDTATGEELWRWEAPAKSVTAVAVSLPPTKSGPVTPPLVYAAAGRSVFVLDWHTGEVRNRFSHPAVVTSLAQTADGNTLVTGSEDGTVRVWDPWVGKELAVLTGHEGPVRSVAIKDDGRWVLSAGSDRTVRLWDAAGKEEVAAFRKHAAPVVAAAFLANGTQTVSGDRDLNLLPWKVDRFFTAARAERPDPPKPPEKIPPAKD
jgi:WD40 repeat protein/mono/diheme cytochrome c family protein